MAEPDLEELISCVVHAALSALAETQNEPALPEWRLAPDWMRSSTLDGVKRRLAEPGAPAERQHQIWADEKHAAGWCYGPVKNPDTREHPCLVPYDELPEPEKRKDALFVAIVDALNPDIAM